MIETSPKGYVNIHIVTKTPKQLMEGYGCGKAGGAGLCGGARDIPHSGDRGKSAPERKEPANPVAPLVPNCLSHNAVP